MPVEAQLVPKGAFPYPTERPHQHTHIRQNDIIRQLDLTSHSCWPHTHHVENRNPLDTVRDGSSQQQRGYSASQLNIATVSPNQGTCSQYRTLSCARRTGLWQAAPCDSALSAGAKIHQGTARHPPSMSSIAPESATLPGEIAHKSCCLDNVSHSRVEGSRQAFHQSSSPPPGRRSGYTSST